MKIGIFGGSFNPIHNGHLFIAEYIREEIGLDKVLFIPVGRPSHREDNLVSAEERCKMISMAIEGNSHFEISDIEIKKKEKNYTIDTLRELKNLYPDDEFFEIIGEDSAAYIEKWKEYDKLLEMAKFIAFRRNGAGYKGEYNIQVLNNPLIEISSTEIRERVKNGLSIKYYLPENVEKYILEQGLYKMYERSLI